mmetsp:Transcript_16932/g.40925  ORF Transcript_16932/g.40925 Transcript_16932/m.40925 type:complete len:436 (+) Transcript_16932:106-1413(+)|eukprot:629424-Rhodomonas_salina.1
MLRKAAALALVLCVASSLADSELKTMWKEITAESGEWGYGHLHERRGQICDPWREFGDTEIEADRGQGCTVLFIADPDDEYHLGTVAEGEQNNFQNTQHYKQAWNLHGKGFLGDSLPRAGKDLDPVCVVAKVEGRLVLGYEEGNGGDLLPCPGHDEGVPFTEEMIQEGLDGTRDLVDMCEQCYQAVCTGDRQVNPQNCGDNNDGAVDLEDDAIYEAQASPVYHCHLTMANEGACDYVQYNQHEASRIYYMDYSVTCGWNNIAKFNITYCDCTRVAGTNNGCRRYEATEMAYVGVVCGNCNGVGFSQTRAYDSIFKPENAGDVYDGSCGKVVTAEEGPARDYAKMMCSKGLWCPNGYNGGDNCKFHCDNFGKGSEVWVDEEGCGEYSSDDKVESRKLLSAEPDAPPLTLDSKFDWGHVTHEFRALGFHARRKLSSL